MRPPPTTTQIKDKTIANIFYLGERSSELNFLTLMRYAVSYPVQLGLWH